MYKFLFVCYSFLNNDDNLNLGRTMNLFNLLSIRDNQSGDSIESQ